MIIPRQLRALALLLASMIGCFVLITSSSGSAKRGDVLGGSETNPLFRQIALCEQSAVVIRGFRICIRELERENEKLYIELDTRFVKPELKTEWIFLHLEFGVGILFWDQTRQSLLKKVWMRCFHDVEFVFEPAVVRESHLLVAPVPVDARFVSIQYGTGKHFTRPIPIPQ